MLTLLWTNDVVFWEGPPSPGPLAVAWRAYRIAMPLVRKHFKNRTGHTFSFSPCTSKKHITNKSTNITSIQTFMDFRFQTVKSVLF